MLEIAELKNKISSILDELKNNDRIDDAYCQELDKSFEDKNLRIGIVGKMKAGKSSLVNAVVFGDDVLPSGVAPVTVTLTEVTYGEQEKAEVTLMTKQDIEDLKEKACYTGKDVSFISKAKSAKGTIESLTPDYEKYLGQPVQTINIDDLKEYVAAGGKFCGLAKSVRIFYNLECLKGITIIDTPGFNDPVSSRGETTKGALEKCQVLLFVHNEDGYDDMDKDLLKEQIRYAGISEMVDVFNRIDMSERPIDEWPEELAYLTKKRDELNISDEHIKVLLQNSHSFYISSLMALCGLIPHDKMSEDIKYQYGRFEEDFEELCQFSDKKEQQEAFVKYSNVLSVINEINRLSKEGSKYLIEGPLMRLDGKLKLVKEVVQSEIEKQQTDLNSLNVSIESKRKDIENFEDFIHTVMGKVEASSLTNDLMRIIQSAIKNVQGLRMSETDKEFSEERYLDPKIGSFGVAKDNIANYNTFIFGFENKIRDEIASLSTKLNQTCKEEVKSLRKSLEDSPLISKESMDCLYTSLVNHFTDVVSRITIMVDSHNIKYIPDGNQKQWDKLKTKFTCDFSDHAIYDLFSQAKQTVDKLDFVIYTSEQLELTKRKIITDLNKKPEEKKKEAKKLQEDIERLSNEMHMIDNNIMEIKKLKEQL